MKLEAYVCECCGGHIDISSMTCPYCGAKYKKDIDDHIIRIETFRNPVETINSVFTIDRYRYEEFKNDPSFMNYVIKDMSQKIAERIIPLCEFQVAEDFNPDYFNEKIRIHSRCRVVVPMERSNSEEVLGYLNRRVK